MPRENFYNPDAAAGTPGESFAVEWDPNHNYAVPGSDTDEGVLVLAGVYMDVSAVLRLQSVLRRALRKDDERKWFEAGRQYERDNQTLFELLG